MSLSIQPVSVCGCSSSQIQVITEPSCRLLNESEMSETGWCTPSSLYAAVGY